MKDSNKTVAIIGSGNVAEALAMAVAGSAHFDLVQIFARNGFRGREIAGMVNTGYSADPSGVAAADIYIIAVSDNAVNEVARKIDFGGAVVAHTAGSVSIDELPACIPNKGVIYPLQTFTKGRRVNFENIPLFIEGSNGSALQVLRELAVELSGSVYECRSEDRIKLHMAAVFACNFTNHMYALGEEILRNADIPAEVIKPLIRETASKALEAENAAQVQTGPAVRNDTGTMQKHLDLLHDNKELQTIYSNISSSIWETSKKISQK